MLSLCKIKKKLLKMVSINTPPFAATLSASFDKYRKLSNIEISWKPTGSLSEVNFSSAKRIF